MRYQLKQIYCRPWTLSGLSLQAHRKPLREQLRRGAAAPERHHRAARIARYRQYAGLRHQRPEARGTGRAQFHAAARALFREHGRRRQGDQQRCPKRSRATSGRCSAGAPSFPPWATRSAAARAGCCSRGCRATGGFINQYASRAQPGDRGRHPGPCARHVRACLPHRLRCQREGLRRHVPAQRRLAGGRGPLRGRNQGGAAAAAGAGGVRATCPASASRR